MTGNKEKIMKDIIQEREKFAKSSPQGLHRDFWETTEELDKDEEIEYHNPTGEKK